MRKRFWNDTRLRIDQACVFRNIQGDRSLLFVREYKAAHELPVEYLRARLRPMDVRKEVGQRPTIPRDPWEKLDYHADRPAAAAVTQTFEYMVDNGLEFSSVATGLAEVYLRVPEDDPETVYYYLVEPKLNVGDTDELGFRYPFTAVSRMLGFTLMALRTTVRDQAWRDWPSKQLYQCNEDVDSGQRSYEQVDEIAWLRLVALGLAGNTNVLMKKILPENQNPVLSPLVTLHYCSPPTIFPCKQL